ncbi:uncharacterized protein LOC119735185 [Patiria miniata]|uniref:Uncharacterized protein n=1 Tax=Patiria miniata TaxID=46514 RepID=A0A914AN17_PATMI|nr:uncharacterized protein LOC119735185 [Patiria miniata]
MASKTVVLLIAFAVAWFPHEALGRLCTFESGICDWTQSTADNYDWSRHRGSTSTSYTGPYYDKTYRNSNGYYLYLESSSGWQGSNAVLLSPIFLHKNGRQTVCVHFWYNMYGSYMGTLKVKRIPTSGNLGQETVLRSWTGQQTDSRTWLEMELCTSDSTSNFRLAFEAVRGNGGRSDMAIDDVEIIVLPATITLSDPTGSLPSTDAVSYLVQGVESQFTCRVTDIDPGASFTWSLGGRELTFARSENGTVSGGLITSTSSLTLSPTWSNHGELLQCSASNKHNHPGLNITATLDIKVPPTVITLYESTDNITATNGTSFLIEGVEREFICEVPGARPAASITWILGSRNITANESTDVVGADGLTTSMSTVRLSPTWNHHGELLQCSASNIDDWPAVNASVTLDVKVLPTSSAMSLYDGTGTRLGQTLDVDQGASSNIRCEVQGTRPAVTFRWILNGTLQQTTHPHPVEADVGLVNSSDTWTFTPSRANHRQEVICAAITAETQEPIPEKAVTLDVIGPPDKPVVTGDKTMEEGLATALTCRADNGFPDDWSLHWSYGHVHDIANITTEPLPSGNRFMFTGVINITPKRNDNGKTMTCTARIKSCTQHHTGAFGPLNVQFCPRRVHITDCALTAVPGINASFSCFSESSNPESDLMWLRNDEEQVNPAESEITSGDYGGRVTTLNFTTGVMTEEDDGAVYRCCAKGNALCPRVCDACLMNVAYVKSNDPGLSAGVGITTIVSVVSIVVIVAGVVYYRRSTTKRRQECKPAKHTGRETGNSDEERYAAVQDEKNTGICMQMVTSAEGE